MAPLPKSPFHVLSPPARERGCSGKLVIDTFVAAVLLLYTYCVPVTPFIAQCSAHGNTVRQILSPCFIEKEVQNGEDFR